MGRAGIARIPGTAAAMPARTILLTLAEDETAGNGEGFEVLHRVDEHDCLAFAAALRARGHEVWYANWRQLDPAARVLRRAYRSNRGRFEHQVDLRRFDLAFVYKMEGFLREQARFFAVVEALEHSCAAVVNAPATIRASIDKSYLFALAARGVEVIPSWRLPGPASVPSGAVPGAHHGGGASEASPAAPADPVMALLTEGSAAVVKPLRGERGEDIHRLDPAQGAAHWRTVTGALDSATHFIQRYEPGIRNGERSLVFLGHEFQHAVIKHPRPSDPAEYRCNESLGGTVRPHVPTTRELAFAGRVLEAAEALGWPVRFSRIDLVHGAAGPVLMEAELLNPSVYANYVGRGAAFGRALAAYFESLVP